MAAPNPDDAPVMKTITLRTPYACAGPGRLSVASAGSFDLRARIADHLAAFRTKQIRNNAMWLPGSFSAALILMVLSTCFWGSWANTYKGARNYPFELFYRDYILGVVLCSWVFGLTLGSSGASGEPFLANLEAADPSNWVQALIGGAIFNVANLLLVAAIDIAGLAIAFPIAIGIA